MHTVNCCLDFECDLTAFSKCKLLLLKELQQQTRENGIFLPFSGEEIGYLGWLVDVQPVVPSHFMYGGRCYMYLHAV